MAADPGVDVGAGRGRGELLRVVLVAGVALAVRVAAFLVARSHDPLFQEPILDGAYHDILARELLAGRAEAAQAYFRAPLYPWLVAGLYALSGGANIALVLALQHALGVGTAVLTYLLARRFVSGGYALAAGLAAALYWPFLYFEDDLLIVTTIVFLDVLALYLLVVGIQGRRMGWFVAAGLVLGLSAIARPSILIVLPVLPLVLRWSGERGGARPRWLAGSLATWAAALVPILPITARNWFVGGDLVLIASQGGVNFHIGNHAGGDGVTAIVPGTRGDWMGGYEDAIRMAEEAEGRALRPSEVSRHYFARGWSFVLGEPSKSVPLLLKKLRLFWAGGERPNNKQIYFFWEEFRLGRWPLPLVGFWLVGPLGLAGIFLAWRRPEARLLAAFVVTYGLGVVAFFVNARFRLPVVPALIVLGVVGVAELAGLWRTDRRRALAWTGGVLLAFAIVDSDHLRFDGRLGANEAASWASVGNAYDSAGRNAEAIEAYERAVELAQAHPSAAFGEIADRVLFDLGRCLWREGDRSRALQLMESGEDDDPRRVRDKVYLAACYVQVGRRESASRVFLQIASWPGQAEYLASQARGWRAKGNLERAELALLALLEAGGHGPSESALRQELEGVYRDLGDEERARAVRDGSH